MMNDVWWDCNLSQVGWGFTVLPELADVTGGGKREGGDGAGQRRREKGRWRFGLRGSAH